LSREPLLKGKLTSLDQSNFDVENIFYLCYKTSYLNEDVNCTEPSPSDNIPWFEFYAFSAKSANIGLPAVFVLFLFKIIQPSLSFAANEVNWASV
jgi:hypothetical protein